MADVVPCGQTIPLIQWKKDRFLFFLWDSASDIQEVTDRYTMMIHEILAILDHRWFNAICDPPLSCQKQSKGDKEIVDPKPENAYNRRDRPLWGLGLVVRYRLKVRMFVDVTCE